MPIQSFCRSVAASFTIGLTLTLFNSAAADISNPSFETVAASSIGDPSFMLPVGWQVDFLADDGTGVPYVTAWADQFASPWIPSPIGPTNGEWMATSFMGGRLRQTVVLNAGDVVLVDIAVATSALLAYGVARVELNGLQSASFELTIGVDQGFGGSSQPWIDWQTAMITVPESGTYELSLFGSFGGNADGATYTQFDNVRVVAVPAPGTVGSLSSAG